jgi:ubiquinone/menaquinone biosynthesis C-methylase UbiE
MDAFAHLNDKRVALNEMGRVLKKGGRLYVLHTLGKEKLAEYHREVGGVVRDDVLPSDSEMREMMEKAGFKDVRIVDQPGLYLASARK